MRDRPFQEVELKLRIPPMQLDALKKSSLLTHLSPKSARPRHVVSVYYDTADQRLRRAGIALRVRTERDRIVQTVKIPSVTGLGHRTSEEHDVRLSSTALDLAAYPDETLRARLAGVIEDKEILALFETDIRRTLRRLQTPAGDGMEVALDVGAIRARGEEEAVAELEFELKAGRPAALYEAAEAFVEPFALIVDPRSKADRGYRLADARRPPAVKAEAPALDGEASAAAVFEAMLVSCARQILANEWPIREGERVEGVHQMRVGLRRLRAVLSMFRELIEGSPLALLATDAKWLAAALGSERDLDVFDTDLLLPVAAAFPGTPGLKMLAARVRSLAGGAKAGVDAVLASERYAHFLFDLSAAIGTRRWLSDAANRQQAAERLATPARVLARELLEKRWRKARKLGKEIETLDIADRHRLRIELKKLRYGAEFFSGLYSGKATRAYVKALAKLQDVFGQLNDVATAERILARLLAAKDHEDGEAERAESLAAGLVLGWHRQRADRDWADAKKLWQRLDKTRPFWAA